MTNAAAERLRKTLAADGWKDTDLDLALAAERRAGFVDGQASALDAIDAGYGAKVRRATVERIRERLATLPPAVTQDDVDAEAVNAILDEEAAR